MEIGKKKNRQWQGRSTRRVNKMQMGKKQKECASDLNDPNQQNEIFFNSKADGKRKTAYNGVKLLMNAEY